MYWFDLLIALLAIVAILDVVLGRGSSGAPTTTLWFCLPALAILVLPLFARRWFPFAGPAAYWLLAAGISFVDPLLIPYPESLFLTGLATAFLLGNLRDVRRAGLGLAIVIGATATLVYNIPGHSVDQLVFIPVDFAVAWVAGLAVSARAEQAEVAESHATQAEQERDAATGVAVAEERARIARELHDIVAHGSRRQRDGAPSRRCQAPTPRRDGRGSRCPQECRAGRAQRAGGDAPSAQCDAP
jgi:signal transduction histidine kinase